MTQYDTVIIKYDAVAIGNQVARRSVCMPRNSRIRDVFFHGEYLALTFERSHVKTIECHMIILAPDNVMIPFPVSYIGSVMCADHPLSISLHVAELRNPEDYPKELEGIKEIV